MFNAKLSTPAQPGKPLFAAPSPAASSPAAPSPASGSAGTGASTPKVPLTSRERKERTKANKEAREAKEREAALADVKAKPTDTVVNAPPAILPPPPKEVPKNCKGIILPKELRQLMYGAGDVHEPLADSIDVVEDMVLAYLSDLCRAPPAILPQPPSYLPITANPPHLTSSIFRSRLASNPALHKQLARFDELAFMQLDISKIKNAAEPGNMDLAAMTGESAKRRSDTTQEEDEAFERAMAQRDANVGEEDGEDDEDSGVTPKKPSKKRSAPSGAPGGPTKKKKVRDEE